MRKRPETLAGWRLNGKWYSTEAEYERALAARDARRRRWLALLGHEDDGEVRGASPD
jgi:hypothetical protein